MIVYLIFCTRNEKNKALNFWYYENYNASQKRLRTRAYSAHFLKLLSTTITTTATIIHKL